LVTKEIYQVLARKYRPKNFSGLIGQEILVRILSNSFINKRIAHAFLLTGIRGTGKTTTARLISKTLNCTSQKIDNSIVLPCEDCLNCKAHSDNTHPDLIELDAASRTGVADIREIIDTSRYLPSLGQYKFYVIDEAHMLSNNAFNALLKTLEEPPEHTKFILATTEIKKIPLTIISRCQRFDLLRISTDILTKHIESIVSIEGYTIERVAASLIAEAAAGSVRDSLSLLDNAILALNDNYSKDITSDNVIKMLGISSPILVYEVLTCIVEGNTNLGLQKLQEVYSLGIDLIQLYEDLLEIVTLLSKLYYNKDIEIPNKFSELEKHIPTWLEKITIEFLSTLWQMMMKGLQEIKLFSNQLSAAEMLLVRLCYITQLPLPSELIDRLNLKQRNNTQYETLNLEANKSKDTLSLSSFEQVLELFKKNKEMVIYHHLYEDVQLIKFEKNQITLNANEFVPKDLAKQVEKFLENWTKEKWSVILSRENGQKTIKEQEKYKKDQLISQYEQDNELIKEIYTKFPGAKIIDIKN
jgi:DNA polymerase-3 subunit gamma/tau